MKLFKNYLLIGLIGFGLFTISCSDDDAPGMENEEEVIDLVRLIFTDSQDNSITIEATDPDGLGPDDFNTPNIQLAADTEYTLAIEFYFTDENENITEEIKNEDDEHMIFFAFTSDIFDSPAGDGNIGSSNRNDPMNYSDSDGANPIGLATSWTTGSAASGGTFRVRLMHQPALTEGGDPQKSDVSTSETGDPDVDVTFNLSIQ